MDQATLDARKFLLGWEGVGVFVMVLSFSYLVYADLVPTLYDIATRAPMLRIYPVSIAGPSAVLFLALTYIVFIIKAIPIPVPNAVPKSIMKAALAFIFVSALIFIFALIFSRPLQRYYFPKHGYTQCELLTGNPTYMFTDWVKNPAWCVKGKDREWVFEQARSSQFKLNAKPTQ
jgi:hypothetical protein